MAERNYQREAVIIAREVALECVIETLKKIKKKIDRETFFKACDCLVQWIYSEGSERNTLINRQAALRRAVMAIEIEDFNITGLSELIDIADIFINYIKK